MEAAGLAVGLVATADLCLKYGRKLITLCHSFQDAESNIIELLLTLKALWLRIQRQILVLRNVEVANGLGEDLQYLQMQMLGVLQSKLHGIGEKVDRLANASLLLRKITYAMYMKESLRGSINELEIWYRRWDPSWFLIARLSVPSVDAALQEQRSKDNLPRKQPLTMLEELRNKTRVIENTSDDLYDFLEDTVTFTLSSQIKYSTVSKVVRLDTNEALLIDPIVYQQNHSSEGNLSKDVQKLASILSTMDSQTCNVLGCSGVRKNTDKGGKLQGFSLALQAPIIRRISHEESIDPSLNIAQLDIRSLRDLMLDTTPAKSLTYRLKAGKSIARSIIFLHSASFVHKNIRPETILVTETGEFYLVGFQCFRAAAGETYMLGDTVQSKNLYRHPARQGQVPEEMYSMQHDVYSLGVCLLEVGLWSSFVKYNDAATESYVNISAIPEASVSPAVRGHKTRAYEVKRKLISLAKTELPSRMGDEYSAVVVSCLTYLDKDSNLGSVDELLEDDNGVIIGVNYIQKILEEIEEIVA